MRSISFKNNLTDKQFVYKLYIYIVIQTDCFVVSQLFGVARHASSFQLGSKPG